MSLSTLTDWLQFIASLHSTEIDLSLERVKMVAQRLRLLNPNCAVITVGGTNGKGSTVAGLEAIYRAAGYRVGAFTTPVLFKYNEQVRINGQEASDAAFCHAFELIESVRDGVSLTPFEFGTLAALLIFKQHDLDVMLLEVGLGGRLDAVNIIDADVAIITSIGIDHVEWLGSTRESIAFEKAGILRAKKFAVCGEIDPPQALLERAAALKSPLLCKGKHFSFVEQDTGWSWRCGDLHYENLPYNMLAVENMATVLMAVRLLQEKIPVTLSDIVSGLTNVALTGRIQIFPGVITEIYDVSHNPAAVTWLAKKLMTLPCSGKTLAVFSMLADKDMVESINAIKDQVTDWYIAPLANKRAATTEQLKQAVAATHIPSHLFASIQEAYSTAKAEATPGDRLLIFGSFHTVADTMAFFGKKIRLF